MKRSTAPKSETERPTPNEGSNETHGASPLAYREYDRWSRWPLRALKTGAASDDGYEVSDYLVELSPPALRPGRQLCFVLEVTSLASRLWHSGGKITADGKLLHGPGEIAAWVPAEGGRALVRLSDGSEEPVPVLTVPVTVTVEMR